MGIRNPASRYNGAISFWLVLPLCTFAQAPGWWVEQGVSEAEPPVETSIFHYAPALLGQGKNLALQAYLAMEARAEASSGEAIEDLVLEFLQAANANHSPLVVGQLKVLAAPFYDRFREVGFAMPSHITLYESGYPWPEPVEGEGEFHPVNLGQLKYVFSFDLDQWPPGGAGDEDTDGDGLLDREEHALGLDPENPDTDGDGIGDGDEVRFGMDPHLADAHGDLDADGISNGDEIRLGLLPDNADSDGDGQGDGVELNAGTDPLHPDHPAVALELHLFMRGD